MDVWITRRDEAMDERNREEGEEGEDDRGREERMTRRGTAKRRVGTVAV